MAGFHTQMSPSSLDRLLICPASYHASQGLQLPSKRETVTGTVAHELHEWCLSTGRKADKRVLDTLIVEEHDRKWDILIDDAMASYVQESVDKINAVPGYIWVEKRVGIDMLTPISGQSGTADAFIVDVESRTLHVVDLKYGLGVQVFAYLNPQMLAYALGALGDICDVFAIERVCLTISQPRLDHFDSWWTTPAELEAIGRFYKQQLVRCLDPKAPFVPAKKSCMFCAAKFTCPARAEQLRRMATSQFDDLDQVDSFDTLMPSHMPDIEMLTVDDLIAVHAHSEQVSGFLRDVRTHLLHLAMRGEDVPGLKLIEGRANRKWRDDVAEMAAANFLLAQGVAPGRVLKIERPSPAKAEGLLPKKLRSSLGEWIVKPSGRPQLVSDEDARPAYRPVGINLFDDLDDDADDNL